MNITTRKPYLPGEILLEEFMQPHQLTQDELARHIKVTRRRINEIINGKRSITPDTALRLAKLFNMTPEYWLNLQLKMDIWMELQNKEIRKNLRNIKSLPKAA